MGWVLELGKEPEGEIGEALFGMNLEITRSTFFGGLSAQMVNNRKFFAGASDAFSRGWTPVGSCALGSENKPVLRLSGAPAGVFQASEMLRMRPGIGYCWRARLAGHFLARLTVRIGDSEDTVQCACEGTNYLTVHGRLWASVPADVGEIRITATGEGTLTLDSVSVLPDDAVLSGLRSDAIDLLRTLRPHSLRFPGGCYAEFYDWKQGLLPQDERTPIHVEGMDFLLGPTFHQDPQDMNLDDFAALCRLVGAQPQYTMRMTDMAPEDAAALVEYANGDKESRWGAVRTKRGHEAPYGIKRWYVGNEIYPFVPGMNDPVAAARRTVEIAQAMKRADPTIELVPSNWALSEWNQAFMAEIQRLGGDGLFARASYHQYLLDIMKDYGDALVVERPVDPDSVERIEECLYAPEKRILPRMQAVRRELVDSGFGRLPVTMDEWNYYWGRRGHPVLALYMAALLHTLIRHGKETGIVEALFFHPVNEGILHVAGGKTTMEDGAKAWQLMRRHGGRQLIPIQSHGSSCDVVASAKENSIYITLVNRSMQKEETIIIPHFSQASVSRIEGWVLERTEDCFRPGSMRPCTLKIDGDTITMPPASMAAVWSELQQSL